MTVHLPHNNKPEGMKRIEGILNGDKSGSKYNRKKILVDHNVEETIEKTLDLGLWVGLIRISYHKIISCARYENNQKIWNRAHNDT